MQSPKIDTLYTQLTGFLLASLLWHLCGSSFTYQLLPRLSAFPGVKKNFQVSKKKKKKVTFGRKSVLPILKGCNECESTCERQTTLEVQLHN